MFESFERYDVKKAFGKYYLFQKDNFIVIVELNIIGGKDTICVKRIKFK